MDWHLFTMISKFYLNRIHKIENNKIIFKAFNGKGYMDHGKYICEEILRRGYEWDLVWLVNDLSTEVPKGVRKVSNKDLDAMIYELATAKVWINDMLFGDYIRKRKGQIYINTKHGTSLTLKKYGFDSPMFVKDKRIEKRWNYNSKITDMVITGSDFDTATYRSGFHYEGPVLQVGSPRADILFKPQSYADIVKKNLEISKETNVILYAPTFRAKKDGDEILYLPPSKYPDFEKLCENLENKTGRKWCVLVKQHPMCKMEETMCSADVLDISAYGDSQEVLCATDILITDYSSIMFDAAFVFKPVFLFVYDSDEYLKNERELWIGLEDLPFPAARNNDEFQQLIDDFNVDLYENKVKSFLDNYGVKEIGNASKKVVDYIEKKIKE